LPVSSLDIIRFLEKEARKPLSARDILSALGLKGRNGREALRLLDELVREGTLVGLKGGRYSLPRQVSLAVGVLSVHRDGYGFVSPLEGNVPDIFIPARFINEAMDGDKVAVRVEHRTPDGKVDGRIIRILERARETVVGRFEMGRRFGYVVPADPRLRHDVLIHPKATMGARPGQVVVARIDTYPTKGRNPEGVVLDVLGESGDPDVDILTIIHRFALPYEFPSDITASLHVPLTVSEDDCRGRVDLRHLPIVTIDGETAKDFDDAVHVRKERENFRLWVCIADVAYYVPEGSPLDHAAYERGTSVYFPGKCIPMLPEALSNGICSLNPGVDRLVLTAEILFDGKGNRIESRFYPAVIRSHARLTYREVRDMISDADAATIDHFPSIYPHLRTMEDLALRLIAMRRRRGSLDFDLPEPEIILDLRGRPGDIVRSERTLANQLIEEFMLAANEAVASFLSEKGVPMLYRVHEAPDLRSLQSLQEFIAHFNYGLSLDEDGVHPRRLQELLAEVAGRPEERMINEVLLRSMKQAHYAATNVGHFGLAAERYCHFTSPIRRYPDLTVHRALREVLKKGMVSSKRKARLEEVLPEMGENLSRLERRAMDAERDAVDLRRCQYMSERVGLEFDGVVSGVRPFGVFVELNDVFVEGLIHISSLVDDFYLYEEELQRLVGQNRRRMFRIGDHVTVCVKSVDILRRQIDFILPDIDESERRSPLRKGRSKRGRSQR